MLNIDGHIDTVYELSSDMGNATLILEENVRTDTESVPTSEPTLRPTGGEGLIVDDDYLDVVINGVSDSDSDAGDDISLTIDASNPILWVIVSLFLCLLGAIVYLLCFWRKGAEREVDVWDSDSDPNLEDAASPRQNSMGHEIEPLIFMPPSPRPANGLPMPARATI